MVYLSIEAARFGYNGFNQNTIIDQFSLCCTSVPAMIKKLKKLFDHQTLYHTCNISAYEPGKKMQSVCRFDTCYNDPMRKKIYVSENDFGVSLRIFD